MSLTFRHIGIFARIRHRDYSETLQSVLRCLTSLGVQTTIEVETAQSLPEKDQYTLVEKEQFTQHCDLILVIGGDGSLLQAAHLAVDANIPVVGINKGRLGFLTDISPNQLEELLPPILKGHYIEEQRFLLNASLLEDKNCCSRHLALNEIVLLPGDVAHMIEFDIHVNQSPVCRQRADGLIVATPTGSTAYALSGGGPILHPALNAITLVPMFPHTLSARPLVISADDSVQLSFPVANDSTPSFSCDGYPRCSIEPQQSLLIEKHKNPLRLIHPEGYHYFETLRSKLNWQSQPSQNNKDA